MPELSREIRPAEELDGQALIWNKILSITDSLVLKCAVKLRIFDAIHLHGRPISLPTLCSSLPTPSLRPSTLLRLLRYLSHIRLINITDDRPPSFSLPPSSSAFLLSTSKQSLASFITIFLDEDFLGAFHALDVCLREGAGEASAFEMVSGETVFERAARDPLLSKKFNEGMAGSGRITAAAMVEGAGRVFEGVRMLIDVGGGMGAAARVVSGAFPGIRVLVYDLPHVVDGLVGSDGVEFVAADMFVEVPQGDAVLLMRILHDWSDGKAMDILEKCREAIDAEKGKLIIADIVLAEEDDDEDDELHHARMASDIMMMAYGGKERTKSEWSSLLLGAGFTRCRFTPINALQHVIEARI
ncbi:3'-hydroxy-N-methyl-(S)-coclaurine 4'-O-methyltransferase-like [Phalaenopsis equestris]|uniref:3'-hydroxy-N-methyl-(S)-coclaurine 4'-O-methyltransferase-like n=1 Tax=Phalaenopsis equestris TaxID=78828 RepID=UPI0009E4AC62|nr:3'-hydroxy-N-methyl-(S)-coclaurine 4'-O-methyltransferase-like [Phalaenopsis equestris]